MLNDISKVLEDSARGGFYLTLGNVLSGIVSALSLIVIARILGYYEEKILLKIS